MLHKRILASLVFLIWYFTVGFICLPVRFTFAHTYMHWIGDAGSDLPMLTRVVGLPLLGLGNYSAISFLFVCLVWAITWLGPLVLIVATWRIRSENKLQDMLIYGGTLYFAVVFLLAVVVAFSLWLPFSLL